MRRGFRAGQFQRTTGARRKKNSWQKFRQESASWQQLAQLERTTL